ncbi:MAG: DNA-processing protein DprA [Flavobacteriales bacterium]
MMALTMLNGVGPIRAKQLIQQFGNVEVIFSENTRRKLVKSSFGKHLSDQINTGDALRKAEREFQFMAKHGIRAVAFDHQDYPRRLLHCPDAPLVLYWKGNPCWNLPTTISVVGTRRPDHEGMALTKQFIQELAPHQPTIISGLAYGIDFTAHQTCLEQDIPTIGVVAHPLHFIYPRQHQKLAEAMLEKGALFSEFPSFTRMLPDLFPMRNRIVAGLCDALVVIQTKCKGGSMITARIAHSYHREIFACPGSILDPLHEGCNELIQSQVANMLLRSSDIGQALGIHTPKKTNQLKLFEPEHEMHRLIFGALQQGMCSADHLAHTLKKPISEVLTALMELELLDAVQSLPGKAYVLK